MLHGLVTRLGAAVEVKRRRLVTGAVAGLFLFAALVFALSAGWIWLAGAYGAIIANLICAATLAILGGLVLLLGRPPRPAPAMAPPVAGAGLADELVAAFVAGTTLGRKIRR